MSAGAVAPGLSGKWRTDEAGARVEIGAVSSMPGRIPLPRDDLREPRFRLCAGADVAQTPPTSPRSWADGRLCGRGDGDAGGDGRLAPGSPPVLLAGHSRRTGGPRVPGASSRTGDARAQGARLGARVDVRDPARSIAPSRRRGAIGSRSMSCEARGASISTAGAISEGPRQPNSPRARPCGMRALALIVILSACSVVSARPASVDRSLAAHRGHAPGKANPDRPRQHRSPSPSRERVGGTAACNSFGGKIGGPWQLDRAQRAVPDRDGVPRLPLMAPRPPTWRPLSLVSDCRGHSRYA